MRYSRKISCCKEELQNVRNFVQKTLEKYNISDVDISQLVLAVDEICANVIIHSHGCNAKESLEVAVYVGKNKGVVFEIKDYGIAFNAFNYHEPYLDKIIKQKKKGGVGLMLVKRIMDKVEFNTHPKKKHNVCRLQKFVNMQAVEEKAAQQSTRR